VIEPVVVQLPAAQTCKPAKRPKRKTHTQQKTPSCFSGLLQVKVALLAVRFQKLVQQMQALYGQHIVHQQIFLT
jgi:hypothetical protein